MNVAKNEPRVIAFVGTVGSGKSTQIKLFASKLHNKGLRVKTTTIKTNHLFAHLLAFILIHILIKKRKDIYPIRTLVEEKPFVFKKAFKLWLVFDLFSISSRFLLTIFLPTRMGYTVLIEEYLPATISDYIYLSRVIGLPLKTLSFAIRFMLKLIHVGGPMKTVFLDAKRSALKSRWKNRRILEEKTEYLTMQRTTLLSLSEEVSSYGVLRIDTSNQGIQETHKMIVKLLIK